jgi:hypothetical protein
MAHPAAPGIYQLMVITAWADNQLDPAEQSTAGRLLHEQPELQGLENRAELARLAREKLQQQGVRAAVAEVAALIPDEPSRNLALQCCAKVLAADGRLAHQEFAVISELRKSWGLPVEAVERIIGNLKR